MTDRTEQVKFRVTPEFKTEIEQFIDESNEADSFASLCRTSIRHRMHDSESNIDSEEISRSVEVALEPVERELEELNDRLANVEQQVRAVDEESIDELANDIYQILPELTEDDLEYEEFGKPIQWQDGEDSFVGVDVHPLWLPLDKLEGEIHNPESVEDVQKASTATAYANFFEVDEATARRALSRMVVSYPDADYIDTDEALRYYRLQGGM